MITVQDVELRAGARLLLSGVTFRVQPGDRIGLVGRNGAGKTTTLTTLAGERLPHAGKVEVSGEIGYLPQDPRSGDLDITASDRVLSGRGLDVLRAQMTKAQVAMAEPAAAEPAAGAPAGADGPADRQRGKRVARARTLEA